MNQEHENAIDDEEHAIEDEEQEPTDNHEERDSSINDREENGKTIIESPHEEEFYMSSSELVQFLRDLADQVEQGNTVTIQTDNWDMPFNFQSEEIEVEIDREYDELEIEIEFDEYIGRKGLSVGS